MSDADKQIIIEMFLLLAVWGGGTLFIVYRSLRRQNLDILNMLNPFVIFILKGRDFLYLLALLILAFGILRVYWIFIKII